MLVSLIYTSYSNIEFTRNAHMVITITFAIICNGITLTNQGCPSCQNNARQFLLRVTTSMKTCIITNLLPQYNTVRMPVITAMFLVLTEYRTIHKYYHITHLICAYIPLQRCSSAVDSTLAYHAASPGSIPGLGGENY